MSTEAQKEACRRWRKKYPERQKAACERWIKNNPHKHQALILRSKKRRELMRRARVLKKTPEEIENFLAGRVHCEICGNPGRHLDHDHQTGKLRGFLCVTCNLLLGHAKDNTEVLDRAAAYLRKHQ